MQTQETNQQQHGAKEQRYEVEGQHRRGERPEVNDIAIWMTPAHVH